MAQGAQVQKIEGLREFKAVLWKFQEAVLLALDDAESELHRVLVWLEHEQDSHWNDQIHKRHDLVEKAKDALRMKKLFKDSSGRPPSTVEEEKALQLALHRLAEAQQKLAATRRWARTLQKEIQHYKGSVRRLAGTVQTEIPAAAAFLEKASVQLDTYVALQAPRGPDLPAAAESGMATSAASEAPDANVPTADAAAATEAAPEAAPPAEPAPDQA